MNGRIAVISDEPGWHGARLKASLARRGWSAAFVSLSQGQLQTLPDRPLALLPGFTTRMPDGIFVRGISGGSLEQLILRLDLLHVYQSRGVLVYNPPRPIELSVDKGIASVMLAQAGLPTPPSWITADPQEAYAIAKKALSRGDWLVSKPLFGSQGEGVQLHTTIDSLTALQPAGGVYYLQRYVGTRPAKDFRLFVINGRVVAAMCRHGADWRTNVAQGGRCQIIVPDKAMISMAEQAARVLHLHYAGVDLIHDESGRLWVIEVNGIPAWKGLQSVCDIDITELLVDDFVARLPA
ncbi:MAG TPA: RimK family alpha-L-glutamate ligase [Methylothermaceae bacterium]|nr:RimK family alpha-L-glutamate ligase [Methylothermaceae bacterium]